MRILVTGGTGTLGRAVVPSLVAAGHPVRVMTRRRGGPGAADEVEADLATGVGLVAAVSGVEAIVHPASAPYRGRYTAEVDVEGTGRLLAAAREAGVSHLLYVSIVGIDRVPWGYFRHKLAAEQLVKNSGLDWSILRTTQFHPFLDRALHAASRAPLLVGDAGIVAQPVDPRDVAGRITARVAAGPSGAVEEFGGPEVLHFDDAARQWMHAHGAHRPLLPVRMPGRLGQAFRAGHLATTAQPTGTITWQEYLADTTASSRATTTAADGAPDVHGSSTTTASAAPGRWPTPRGRLHRAVAAMTRLTGTTPLTIRVDLDPPV